MDGKSGAHVTLSDVAAEAGVDLSTASRALRGEGRMGAETRQRVLDVADRLHFRPNAQAQFLAKGMSKTVGILTLDAPDTFSMPVLAGVNNTLGRQDVASLLYDVHLDSADLRESVEKLKARRVDGMLVLGNGLLTPLPSITAEFDVPVVYAFCLSDDPADAWFVPDGRMAGRLAGEHLVSIGRRRIAHITAAKDFSARDRADGLREVLASAGLGLAFGDPLEGDWQRTWGVEAARRILPRLDEVDAIFCGNDQIARGAIDALRERGIAVPDAVAIVGFDNWEIMAEAARPPLTSVDMNLRELGGAAGVTLLRMIEGRTEKGVRRFPCSLVVRESCGARARA